MKNIMKILIILSKFVEDIFILLGLILISIATFEINKIAGMYVVGIICLVLGVIMAKKPKGGD